MGLLLFSCAAVGAVNSTTASASEAPSFYQSVGGYPVEADRYGRLMVGVHVNGIGPFPFIVDTGASRSVIYRSLTADMKLAAVPNKSRNVITANGYKRVLIYPLRDIYALGHTLELTETVALPDIPNSSAKGLIGVDLLAGKTLLVQPGQALASLLENAETLSVDAGWRFEQGRAVAYGSLALELDMGGVQVPLVVDTGASDTVINVAGAEALLRSARGIKTEKITAVIARGRTVARERLVVPEFMLGGKSFKDTSIYVADVPVFRLLGAGKVPAIILGMNVLDQQDFAIDFEEWRLYLQR